jgi:uncharacterized repeat protein (TIGR02543 family)
MKSSLSSGDQTITLYAEWTKNLTLTYNNNKGSGGPSEETVTIRYPTSSYTFNIPTNNKPSRTGYTFKGWNTSSTATSASHSSGGTINLSSNDTLYAVWQANTNTAYTVKNWQ